MRQTEYLYRRGSDIPRAVDPLSYLPMIRHILIEQGGQVVRLGDPSMTPLPPLPGLIDLSRYAESFALQAFAMSRARYFVGTDSGTTQLACAFRTPSASTNALGVGVWNDGDVVLTKTVRCPNGLPMTRDELISCGILGNLHGLRPHELSIEDNAPRQLVDVARHMHAITAGGDGWRQPAADGPTAKTTVRLPLGLRDIAQAPGLTWWD